MHFCAEDVLDEFYKYDKDLPLNASESESLSAPDAASKEFHVTFDSARDQRVCSLLTLPEQALPPYPAVIILHGVFGHKSSPNQLKRSAHLVRAGYATLRIDAQYCGERQIPFINGASIHPRYYYRNRDAMIQTALDLMRAVDYLATRQDVDMRKVGFAGFSMGGAVGAIFSSYEERIKAVVLGITGGDFSKWKVSAPDGRALERMLQAYHLVDPIHYVRKISPRRLLMQNARNDIIISRDAAEALFNAALDPKQIIWYDCGHADMPDESLEDMRRFFDECLRPNT
ncbi:MAG: hypothetical protein C4520_20900 [Candidatus Abyssobacteria bacterium SURF_5]|uniref:Dienelactone hydrolase domain-containing protein n=1 Tax=Abyssobacteria bacterium (strain SURF_5) TaxID=2093360 RepID=A0A3A4NDN0_ABYX5|nr:MAG: hypothetical protein C4520_20900 [Candidatus Abyssubacteria bacterium SURF_5]